MSNKPTTADAELILKLYDLSAAKPKFAKHETGGWASGPNPPMRS